MNKLLILVLLFSSSCSLAMEKYEKADLRKMSLLITESEIKHIGKHSNDHCISYYALREKDTVEATLFLTGPHKGEYYGTLTSPAEGNFLLRWELKGQELFNRLKYLYETYSQNNQS